MKERPILFSGPMVRAILEGRKIQTRQIAKEETVSVKGKVRHFEQVAHRVIRPDGTAVAAFLERCPYGQPGDRLWARETFARIGDETCFAADGTIIGCHRWLSPVCMPRSASRITLDITGVRVERLQDISEADARAEGAVQIGVETGQITASSQPIEIGSYVADYCDIWSDINGRHSWDANPWVWVIEFKQLEKGI